MEMMHPTRFSVSVGNKSGPEVTKELTVGIANARPAVVPLHSLTNPSCKIKVMDDKPCKGSLASTTA